MAVVQARVQVIINMGHQTSSAGRQLASPPAVVCSNQARAGAPEVHDALRGPCPLQ